MQKPPALVLISLDMLERKKVTRSTCSNLEKYLLLRIGESIIIVSPTLMDGYRQACKAHRGMEEQAEYDAYFRLDWL